MTECTKQMFYLTLASAEGVRLTAKENAKGLGNCVNDLSAPCRAHFVEQIAASRAECGAGDVSTEDLNLAMKPILDNMEAAVQSAVDSGLIQLPTVPANNAQWWTWYGGEKDDGVNEIVQASTTPAFRKRFPSTKYAIVFLAALVGSPGDQYCHVEGGVSARSAGVKSLRVPVYRFYADEKLKSGADSAGRLVCQQAATKTLLKNMMAMEPQDLALKTDASL